MATLLAASDSLNHSLLYELMMFDGVDGFVIYHRFSEVDNISQYDTLSNIALL